MNNINMCLIAARALQRTLISNRNVLCLNKSKAKLSSQTSSTKTNSEQLAQSKISELCKVFESAGISEPQQSAELLVGEALGVRNLDKLMSVASHSSLSDQQSEKLAIMSQCRLANMPLQYILGYWDFRELRLKMRPPVFIPRPETEELVGIVLKHLTCFEDQKVINVLEIGCGSGAISLSLLKEYTNKSNHLKILAIDQSASACNLTSENAAEILLEKESISLNQNNEEQTPSNHIEVKNIKLNGEQEKKFGLENQVCSDQMDVLVSNPPYVLRKDLSQLDPQISLYEDLRALDGGKDGLQTIENILMLSSVVLKPGSHIFLEIDPCHKFLLPALLKEINEKIEENGNKIVLESISKDFLDNDRFAILKKCLVQK